MKKRKKDFWEKLFLYPTFRMRFWVSVIFVLIVFVIGGIFILPLLSALSDKIAIMNLLVQSATLFLGVLAAYYAFRQVIETRFDRLDENGMQNLKRKQYARAIRSWKEAFYIRPDASVFCNLAEAYLLQGDFEGFDETLKGMQVNAVFRNEVFQEDVERLELIYLKVVRHLLVENLGEAKKHIGDLVKLSKETGALVSFVWDFSDLTGSDSYKKLSGDSLTIVDNLMKYLGKSFSEEEKVNFENGNFLSPNKK